MSDAFWPRYRQNGIDDVAALPNGWVIMRGDHVTALDRNGKQVWTVNKQKHGFLDRNRLHITSRGDALIVTHQRMSHTGAFCQVLAAKDGELRWTRQVHGLGVSHSKYFHHVYARIRKGPDRPGEPGSSGAFTETVDKADGSQLSRFKVR